jgi:hypothetical protein
MTFEQFILSLQDDHPPEFSTYLESLWYEKKGDWDKAHRIAQDIRDKNGNWIHAYIHRVEGDEWNSNYWYSRAGKEMSEASLGSEWESLVRYFLKHGGLNGVLNN